MGELAEAEVWFRKTRDLAERWASDETGNTQARVMLAWSYRKLADMRKLSKDDAAAWSDYLQAIAIGRELVSAEPDNLMGEPVKKDPATRAARPSVSRPSVCYKAVTESVGSPGTSRPIW